MKTFILSILITLSGSLTAQDASSIVKWGHETIDLGAVKKGDKVNNEFTFTNISSVPVEIDLVSTCECTDAKWTIGEIAPGEQGSIKFTFDSSQKDEEVPIDVDVYFLNRDANDNPMSTFLSYTFTFVK